MVVIREFSFRFNIFTIGCISLNLNVLSLVCNNLESIEPVNCHITDNRHLLFFFLLVHAFAFIRYFLHNCDRCAFLGIFILLFFLIGLFNHLNVLLAMGVLYLLFTVFTLDNVGSDKDHDHDYHYYYNENDD
jgi:hypothetical protein